MARRNTTSTLALTLALALACSSATKTTPPTLQLVDGTGGSLITGSIQQSGSAVQTTTGIDVVFTVKNVGAADTTFALSPCFPQARVYTAATGGSLAYPTNGGRVCTMMAILVKLAPGEARSRTLTLNADTVASQLSPRRYYLRLGPIYAAGTTELPAGVVDRP